MTPAVFVGPQPDETLMAAVVDGGGRCVGPEAAEAAVWLAGPAELADALRPGWRWVQLPSAGVEHYVERGLLDEERVWTSAAGAFGRVVADHALALVLACRRRLAESARADGWRSIEGRPLDGARVLLVGAGEIGQALIDLLAPWDVRITAVTRSGREVPGAATSLPASRLGEAWPQADVVVLAAPSTAATRHLVDAPAFAALPDGAVLVNVARGALVDTDALLAALRDGPLAAAAVDVTDPEPLPDGHPLWSAPGMLVTPHAANPAASRSPSLGRHVRDNVRRFAAGEPLCGRIDVARGY